MDLLSKLTKKSAKTDAAGKAAMQKVTPHLGL